MRKNINTVQHDLTLQRLGLTARRRFASFPPAAAPRPDNADKGRALRFSGCNSSLSCPCVASDGPTHTSRRNSVKPAPKITR